MKTHILLADDPQAISDAQQLLRQGRVIAFPTDTVYGVGTHAFLPDAVAALYAAKGRPMSKAIPVLIARTDHVSRVARDVPAAAWQLADKFWPGDLTIVLPRADELPAIVTGGGDTVAVRCPHHAILLTLMNAIDAPLAATSANLSGQPPPTTARQVAAQLAGRIPLIIDGGDSPGGIPSTVVDLSTCPPRLLRTGAVAAHQLRRLLPDLIEVE